MPKMTTNEGVFENEVASVTSWTITNVCQLLPKSITLATVTDHMHNLAETPNQISTQYSIVCGSFAEFYIRPLITCIDDIDMLLLHSNELTFSGDFPLLPSDMSGLSDNINCYKIEGYDRFPGFLRLRDAGTMKYNWNDRQYEFHDTAQPNEYLYVKQDPVARDHFIRENEKEKRITSVNGPAIKYRKDFENDLPIDSVRCLWCPQWPKEAENWPKRSRYLEWPTVDTISEVVQNGCHVVYAQHRSCKKDIAQWRLSFSFAEVILLQSWTKTQQIVYHMLRFFAKRELIQKNCPKEDEVLCTYHLKTLMLWTCEEMSPEWWNSFSVISICFELLKKISDWLKKGYCPNYFIPEANLFQRPSSPAILDQTKKRLNEFRHSETLGQWFVENYLIPVIQLQNASKASKAPNCMDYLRVLRVHFPKIREARKLKSVDLFVSYRIGYSFADCRFVIKKRFDSGLRWGLRLGHYEIIYVKYMRKKSKLILNPTLESTSCIRHYDNLLCTLHVVYGLCCGDIRLSWDSLLLDDFVRSVSMQPKIIRSWYHNFPKMYNTQNTWFQFLRAQNLMENLNGSNYRSEFQLVSLMSKVLLIEAQEYGYPHCKCIAPTALAYLAALHFAASECQQAIRYSLAVLDAQNSHEKIEALNAGCLLFIDDIARIVGLYILCKKITENGLHYIGRRIYLDLRLSPKVFAHHLIVSYDRRHSTHLEFNLDLPDSAFQMDEYLKASIKSKYRDSKRPMSNMSTHFNAARQIVYHRTNSLAETEAADTNSVLLNGTLINALMEYALEHLTTFYSLIHQDFGIQCNTVDCYRALYLYKCRRYHEALQLCDQLLHQPDLKKDLKKFVFANVLLLPLFDSFFDEDMQSLLGLHTLFYYLSPMNDEMRKYEITPESSFAHHFSKTTYFHGNDLSRYLLGKYSVKCHYFVGRHFIARYLKVRCFNDCNLSYEDDLAEFTVQKTEFPFEQIIQRFLLQKFRDVKTI